MTTFRISSGSPHRLGAHADANGVNFAVFSQNATRIEVCFFAADGTTETGRITLPERTGSVWHGHVAGVTPRTLYGLRAHGIYAPDQGHRFNPHKLLADPYSREFVGAWTDNAANLGYDPDAANEDLSFDTTDNAAIAPKSVIPDPAAFPVLPRTKVDTGGRDLIYEAHVKGLTQGHPDVPEHLRGTYEGLATPAIINHLKAMGVAAIELLPVHAFVDDSFLVKRGLRNYWGYNSIGFFAAEQRYFGPDGLEGFRTMVAAMHAAGIEVILDVVYNHTAEGDQRGPTLSFRGLDNASYYRLSSGQARYYVNDTGCGNTLNVSHPYVLRMVLDSLRFWVECMGVDGFRFDLATTMGRELYGFDRHGGFFDALRQDPVLSGVRLIAEPWDIGPGGYRLGDFPHEFSEWNDGYRDTARRYWRGDAHSTQELGARLLGSADTFERPGRRSTASVNFIASHDGFTLADTTSYIERHNEANTENNNDGHHANFSDNGGVEGETDDPEILEKRRRRRRNLLATLFFSQGTPMMLAGDEFANSQNGNNNAYCQDNETGWLSWRDADLGQVGFVAALSAFRVAHPCLRQSRFLHGATRAADGLRDVEWTDFAQTALRWRDPLLSDFCLTLRHSAEAPDFEPDDDAVFIAFNRSDRDKPVTLPSAPAGCHWRRSIDTARGDQSELPEGLVVTADSVAAFSLSEAVAE